MANIVQRRFVVFTICFVIFSSSFILFPTRPLNFDQKSQSTNDNSTVPDNDTKYILYWIPMWKSKTFYFGSTGFKVFENCQIKNCFATHNRNLIPAEQFDAIVMHAPEYNLQDSPSVRRSHQRYIFANMEHPMWSDNLKDLKSYYNWTMTYRSDSDIPMVYGYVVKNSTNYTLPDIQYVNNKPHLVAWVVSHCFTTSLREVIYYQLQNFLKVDVYGKCGNLSCPNDCFDFIEQNYKFYLSFENAYCQDYVTEKLYNILTRNIVPVVYGGADYEKCAPPNSVIIAEKFANVKDLANYLIYLHKDPQKYLKYFEWKKNYYIETYKNKTVCQLCKMLHDPSQPRKAYKNIRWWWSGERCKNFATLPNITVAQPGLTLSYFRVIQT